TDDGVNRRDGGAVVDVVVVVEHAADAKSVAVLPGERCDGVIETFRFVVLYEHAHADAEFVWLGYCDVIVTVPEECRDGVLDTWRLAQNRFVTGTAYGDVAAQVQRILHVIYALQHMHDTATHRGGAIYSRLNRSIRRAGDFALGLPHGDVKSICHVESL